MSNLPKWNLDSIYPDINSSAFTDAVKNFKEQIEQLLKINLNEFCKIFTQNYIFFAF